MAQRLNSEFFFGVVTPEQELESLRRQCSLLASAVNDSEKTAYTKEEVIQLIRCTVGYTVGIN